MTVEILDFIEEVIEYPTTPANLSPAAAALDPAIVWDRIYSWIAYRWGDTLAEWTCQGGAEEEFVLPLTPASVTAAAYWSDPEQDWINVTFRRGPRGVQIPSDNTWRVSAVCGGTPDAPIQVNEAFRRLAEYMASNKETPAGVSSINSGDLSLRFRPEHVARAMQYSGAADLLRPYRKLGRH